MILVTIKKRFFNFRWVSKFKNRMNAILELVSRFVASLVLTENVSRVGSLLNEHIASGFPEASRSREELDIKLSRLV